MFLTEYDEAETMALFMKEWFDEGYALGFAEGYALGRDSVRVESTRALMETLKLTPRQAMELLGIPSAEQYKYESML